jgi:DNA topoisomerase IB
MPVLVEDAVDDFGKLTERLPASVTTTRTSQADLKTRQLIVWIDGKRVATRRPSLRHLEADVLSRR